jgi:DNA-3-methyladenine glycosylase
MKSTKKRLPKKFYLQDPVTVARNLLGKFLWRSTEKGIMAGKIVETEAYLSENDPACHASLKKTKRNEKMFEPGGISYVYLIYGCYYCFNVVTAPAGKGEAVLIRALEPVEGQDIMNIYRPLKKLKDLTNGPGKLCTALDITIKENGLDLSESNELFITEGEKVDPDDIFVTTRIGLTKAVDLPLRFYITGNEFVSKK